MFKKLLLTTSLLAGALLTLPAHATVITIANPGDTGTAPDGTVFLGDPNPTEPSTGTGVFNPFLRVHLPTSGNGNENGFNTDHGSVGINFTTKDGAWTHSVLLSQLALVTYGTGVYYQLQLDANEIGTAEGNIITLSDMQIFVGPGLSDPEATGGGNANTGYAGTM